MTCHFADVLTSLGFGLLGGLALTAFIALLGYRRPWKIAGFHNLRMIKVGLAMGWGGFWGTFGAALAGYCPIPHTGLWLWVEMIWIAFPSVFGAVWAIYWDIPFFRKRTGNNAVDATIARYRRPGETVWAGLPRIVDKDGQRYVIAAYTRGGEVEAFLALNEETGEVVTDARRMERLARCARLAVEMAGFPSLYRRLRAYGQTRKMLRAWPRAMRVFERRMGVFKGQAALVSDVEAVREGWEIGRRYAEKLMAMWEEEGEWANAHGWEQMKEVRCEELEDLDERLRAPYLYLWEKLPEMRRAVEGAKRLEKALGEKKMRTSQRERVAPYLAFIRELEKSVELLENWPEGRPFRRFMWTEDERRRWRERLQLVEGGKG